MSELPNISPESLRLIQESPEDVIMVVVRTMDDTATYCGWKEEWVVRCAVDKGTLDRTRATLQWALDNLDELVLQYMPRSGVN